VSRQLQLAVAVGSVVAAIVALLFYTVIGRAPDESHDYRLFLVFGLVCIAVGAGIFLVAIPLIEAEREPHTRFAQAGLASSMLGLVALIFYWTGLPFVFGAGGVVLGALAETGAERRLEDESGGITRQDEAQETREDDPATATAQRATQGWVARVLGALVFAACVIAFLISLLGA
jgi:hypothetical protein